MLLNKKEAWQCYIQKLNFWNVLFDLHQGIVTNEHEYVTKMSQKFTMGGLWGHFIIMFWITKHVQKSIYMWNQKYKKWGAIH